ncbi:hypothetical protein FRX31_009248 [Thalictrum thalictroides]|uniref:Uncharacterized protein n=1 Tax=Thalictrum thalictroides TaxID=46969 RepID=A0A7J6WYF1_THATH|nr:hypothetical protein FRX31_009248 [Thalictrum thalictroides]
MHFGFSLLPPLKKLQVGHDRKPIAIKGDFYELLSGIWNDASLKKFFDRFPLPLLISFCKEGDTVLLPEYGGTEIKLGEIELGNFEYDSPMVAAVELQWEVETSEDDASITAMF